MFHLILDLETTGIPASRYPHYSDNDGYKNSRIVQVAMILCDSSFNLIDEMNIIIKRDGFDINNSHIHGISNDTSDNGLPFAEVLPKIRELVSNCITMIAHNIGFDINILLNELYRHGATDLIELIQSKKQLCTMESTRTIVNAKDRIGRLKNPKLGELYEYCYPDLKFEEKHEAGHDVKSLLYCLKILGTNIMDKAKSYVNKPSHQITKNIGVLTETSIIPFGNYKGKKIHELNLNYIRFIVNNKTNSPEWKPYIEYFKTILVKNQVFKGSITNRISTIDNAMYLDIMKNLFKDKIRLPKISKLGLNDNIMRFIQALRKIDSRFCGVYVETLFNLCIAYLTTDSTGNEAPISFRVNPIIYPGIVKHTFDLLSTINCNTCKLDEYKLCNIHQGLFVYIIPELACLCSWDLSILNNRFNFKRLKLLRQLGVYTNNNILMKVLKYSIQSDYDRLCISLSNENIIKIVDEIEKSDVFSILNNLNKIIQVQFNDITKVQIHKSFSIPMHVELDILYDNHIIEIKCISPDSYYKSWLQLLGQLYYLDKPSEISIFNFNTNEKITINVDNINKDDIKNYLDFLDNKKDLCTSD
jgi:DNA polymerase III epsilon subunit-like protein